MYEKFEKFGLDDYPPEIRGRFNSFITTQFDDSLSVEMQLRSIIKWAKDNFNETVNQTNNFIDFINDLIGYMNNFIETFDEKYQETILNKMQEWYDNGELETLINESLDTKYNEMDNRLTTQLAQTVSGFKPSWSIWTEFEQRHINVKWFGAVGDALFYNESTKKYYSDSNMTVQATDNQTAFQQAVDFLHSIGGGTLYVPSGKYMFRSGVKWESKVSLIGGGKSSTFFYTEGSIYSLFYNVDGEGSGQDGENADVWLEDCRFKDFTCDLIGLTYTESSITGKALFILYMKRAEFSSLVLKNTIGTALGCDFLVDTTIDNVVTYNAGRNFKASGTNAGQSGIGIGTSALTEESLVVTNCYTYFSGNYGIFVETQNNPDNKKAIGAKILNCHAYGNRIGLANKGSGTTQFNGCTSISNLESGISLSQGSFDDQVTNCIIEKNGEDGIYLYLNYVGGTLITNNTIKENGGHGVYGHKLESSDISEDISILNNVIKDNGKNGVYFPRRYQKVEIKGNTIRNNGQLSTNSYTNRGILIEGGLDNDDFNIVGNTVTDDQIEKTQIVGIEIGSGIENYYLEANSSTGSTEENNYHINTSNGVIGSNKGLKRGVSGIGTIPNASRNVYVNHYLGNEDLKSVTITPLGNEHLWVNPVFEPNRIQVVRDGVTDSIDFKYRIESY